ncbi:hypothetical protein [Candidatus Symbiothrix dinenymphae]|uniref:hypothetical protein n=1 Tax=Candidatus Symbiothrix dinenymphae TaxID=467085 RepID=UPI000702928A|nr:hypothetical protein [Candidatus Symbiothrix dinenymphae]
MKRKNVLKTCLSCSLMLVLVGVSGCLDDNVANTQTSGVMPAVVGVDASNTLLKTDWGSVVVPSDKAGSLNANECVLTQFQVDWTQQPDYATKGYITPMQVDISDPIAQTAVTLVSEVPVPGDYTDSIANGQFVNFLLSKRWYSEIARPMFENQTVVYRLELVATADYSYDAYLMAKGSAPSESNSLVVGTEPHFFDFSAILVPEITEATTTRPYITINLKYYTGGETTVWKSISSPITLTLQH